MAVQLSPSGVYKPEKYPQGSVGAYYQHYGEQPGYIYLPWKDRYVPDPQAQKEYLESTGLADKQKDPPSTGEQLGTVAAGSAASALGTYLGSQALATGGTAAATGAAAGGATAAGTGAATAGSTGLLAGTGGTAAATGAGGATATGAGAGSAAGAGTAAGVTAGTAAAGAGIAAGAYLAGKGTHDTRLALSDGNVTKDDSTQGAAVFGDPSGMGAVDQGGYAVFGKMLGIDEQEHQNAQMHLAMMSGNALPWLNDKGIIKLGSVDTEKEERRLWKLQKEGKFGHDVSKFREHRSPYQIVKDYQDKGVADDFVGYNDKGEWINMKFANNRITDNLRPVDIINYAAFYEKFEDWEKKSQKEKEAIAAQYLNSKAVQEKGGTINLKHHKLLEPLKTGEEAVKWYDKQSKDWKESNVGLLSGAKPENNSQGSPGMRPGKTWNGSKYVDNKKKQETKTDKVFNQVGTI